VIGQVFGDYRVLEKRGEGGMGMFFKAVDQRLDRIVGLKTLHADLLADPNLRERLQTEAKSLARLDHQNIARLLHYLVVGDLHFIVMEFVEGLDLSETIKKSGLLSFDSLASISDQTCAAMSYAHAKGVVHRDLKPSNILLTPDGRVKVTDFGIAKILGASSQTRTGTATGSLPYMAPEQIRAAEVDGRTDIYQLGIMLFELTAGRRPFVSDSEYEMMRMHLEDPPPLPSSVNFRVPPAVDAVVLRALAKSPADRFQTADELNAALQPALASGDSEGQTIIAVPARHVQPRQSPVADNEKTMMPVGKVSPPPTPRPAASLPHRSEAPPPKESGRSGRGKLLAWITGVAVVVVAILIYALWPRGAPPPKQEPSSTSTTTTALHPKAEPVPVSVRAEIPNGLARDRVRAVTLEVIHPDSGSSLDTVPAVGGLIQTDFNVGPADSIRLILRGYDTASRKLFEGRVTRNAPAGSRLFVDIPVTLLVTVDSVRHREVVPEAAANLVINVTPFSERDRIDKVWLDDRPISGSFPIRQKVDQGRHKLRWQIGANRWTDTVSVAAQGKPTEKDLFVGSGFARVTVSATLAGSNGYADIWLDGVATGLGTPGRLESVVAGPHEVAVRREGYQMRGGTQIVEVRANSDTLIRFEMVPR